MGRFDAPYPGNEKTKNSQWYHAAPRGIRSPDQLWKEYWQRFNTFCIPLFDQEDYFKIATTIAKDSRSKEDFERRFKEHNERRLGELQSILGMMYWDLALEETLSPRAVRGATSDPESLSDSKSLRCLEHLVRLLHGYFLDGKVDIESAKIVVEKQDYTEEDSLPGGGPAFAEDETETLIGEIDRSPSVDPEHEEFLRTGVIREEWVSQLPHDIDWGYKLEEEYKARQVRHGASDFFASPNIESLTGASDDAALHTLCPDDDVPSIRRVPSLVLNDSQDLEEGNETATHAGLRRRSSISSKSSSTNSAKKRVRFDDDEDVSNHEPKRRKLENTLSHVETSPPLQTTRASSIQAANGRASRKRSRPDEDEEDNGYKRQKIETLPRSPSPVPVAGSTEDDLANHLAQGSLENAIEEQAPESNKGGRKRRKQKPTSPTSRAISSRNTLNTRSSRRAKSSTLWELDPSGKPRST